MKNLPAKFLSDKRRKEMWGEAKKIVEKIDKALDLSQIYVVGSYVSKKKKINDIDFVIVSKARKKKSNISWPVDFIIVPENEDIKEYLQFFKKYMKRKYGSSSKPIRLK